MRSVYHQTAIEKAADREPLSHGERLILVENADLGSEGLKAALWTLWSWSGFAEIRPSYRLIAARMNCDRVTAIHRIQALERCGVVVRRQRFTYKGKQDSNLYEIDFAALAGRQLDYRRPSIAEDEAQPVDGSLPPTQVADHDARGCGSQPLPVADRNPKQTNKIPVREIP